VKDVSFGMFFRKTSHILHNQPAVHQHLFRARWGHDPDNAGRGGGDLRPDPVEESRQVRILFRGRCGGDLRSAGGGQAAGLELQVHGGGVPHRFRPRWGALAESLHGYGGPAPVRDRGEERTREAA